MQCVLVAPDSSVAPACKAWDAFFALEIGSMPGNEIQAACLVQGLDHHIAELGRTAASAHMAMHGDTASTRTHMQIVGL